MPRHPSPPLRADDIRGLDLPALIVLLRQHLNEAIKLGDIIASEAAISAERLYIGNLPPYEEADSPRDPRDL